MSGPDRSGERTIDDAEVARFAAMAREWWDPHGKFRPLHAIGPARMAFVRDRLSAHFGRDGRGLKPFLGLAVLDIGCGGGLVCEPLARLGARVTGLDPAEANTRVARAHAEAQDLDIEYVTGRVEDLAAEGRQFDAVVCLEVVEHVPDVAAFLKTCASLLLPGGIMVLSTINRTLKSFALAIVGAEYVLRWLPVGTHQWERFVTPDELSRHLTAVGLQMRNVEGLVYNPLADRWSRGRDSDVNYMTSASAAEPPARSDGAAMN
jgi:2-polyprenyl-6-hydroxyphenyl methylase/3-demethylubiquinone-9 3-methyltransferase